MTAITRDITKPGAFERAHDKFTDVLQAIDRGFLNDAISHAREGLDILRVEEQFRDAKRGAA